MIEQPESPDLQAPGRPDVSPLKRKIVADPVGEAWHAESRSRWERAVLASPEVPILAYEAVPLPDFNANRPEHVTRPLLGRFLQDRDTGIVHDCHAVTPECGIDKIRNGTFFHFWSEVVDHLQEDSPCPLCLP